MYTILWFTIVSLKYNMYILKGTCEGHPWLALLCVSKSIHTVWKSSAKGVQIMVVYYVTLGEFVAKRKKSALKLPVQRMC